MAFIETIRRLTATAPLQYRPEDTVWVKIQFVQSDGVTPYDMSNYDLELSVYAPTISTDFPSNLVTKISDGTEQYKKVVAVRRSRDNNGNVLVVNEDGIYLEDAEQSIFTIQYGKEEGTVFLIGEYIMTLSARLEHGQWKSLLSFNVKFHNEVVDNGVVTSNPNSFILPIVRTETQTYVLPIQKLL